MREVDDGFRTQSLEYGVPEHDIDGLWLYMTEGIDPGGFLTAVLSNNLLESLGRADHINRGKIFNIVSFLYSCFPSPAWGSEGKVREWLRSFSNLKKSR